MKKVSRSGKYKISVTGHRSPAGFTLMELLLAITLFSIIAVAIYSSLAMGIKAYKRGSYLGGEYDDFRLVLHRIARDFRTAISINEIYLVEESQKLYFFSVQPSQGGAKEIYKITYSWESEKDYLTLLRLREKYVDSLQSEHAKSDKLLDRLKQIEFNYGYIKKGMSGMEDFYWKEGWKEKAMPKMVRLKIKTKNENFLKVIYCPAGKLGELKEE